MGAMTTIVIPRRFNGPPSSANGGYAAGALAEAAGLEDVTVQIRRPPPLETPLDPDKMVVAFRMWDEQVGGAKRK